MPFGGPLDPALLYIAVFGAGSGECIMVRSPEEPAWLVVDSFRLRGSREPIASHVLRELETRWSALVMSHPHTDHARGFADLLRSNGQGPVGCYMPPPDPLADEDHINWPYQEPGLEAQVGLQSIQTRWDADEATRWDFATDLTPRTIGVVQVLPLWPRPDIPVTSTSLNAWSTPLLLRWSAVEVLLGADLPNLQWAALAGAANAPNLGVHAALKVAHHASRGSQAREVLVGGSSKRFAVTTPFFSQQLPRFGDHQGAHVILQQRQELALTALPDADYSQTMTRAEALVLETARSSRTRTLGRATRRVVRRDPLGCWHLVGIDADGVERDRRAGPEATIITR
jgi:beta-lactamase superfamily II metal-dependent hydrolase